MVKAYLAILRHSIIKRSLTHNFGQKLEGPYLHLEALPPGVPYFAPAHQECDSLKAAVRWG